MPEGLEESIRIEDNVGYKGVNLWHNGVRQYYSVAQLCHLLFRNLALISNKLLVIEA